MRPKVVISVLLVAVGLLGAFALLSKLTSRLATPIPQEVAASSSPTNSAIKQVQAATAAANEPLPSPALVVVPAQTNHSEYVHQRVAELNALAMNNDSASLETILSELRNPDRQIRKGALEATIQFEDRAAVPRLKEIAAETDDEEEKSELLAAADYLNLPSLTEYLAQQEAQREADGTADQPPVSRTNRFLNPAHIPSPRQRMQAAAAQAQAGQ